MNQTQETLQSRSFNEFGTTFDVHIKDMYQAENPRFFQLDWFVTCEGETSPTKMVILPYGGDQGVPPKVDTLGKKMAARIGLMATGFKKKGDVVEISLFEGTPLDPRDNLQWHPRLKTFNEHAWKEAN